MGSVVNRVGWVVVIARRIKAESSVTRTFIIAFFLLYFRL